MPLVRYGALLLADLSEQPQAERDYCLAWPIGKCFVDSLFQQRLKPAPHISFGVFAP
jgi:hypothetical protein